ncbi:translation initiation factor 2 [Streptomyces sp. A1-5]|uniref:translation initiation factor 2 n=1 Tax=Streptomyces sp. A1-5 TaxID=2738410 RepID=UPI001F29BBB4|nr:translation initiation factor 2 [Streptomyces sp. A1-5]
MPSIPLPEPAPNCGNGIREAARPTRMDGPCQSGQRAAGSGQRAAGSGQRAAGSGSGGRRAVLFAVRSAVALHRLLDVLPVFSGDDRIERRFSLIPGSDFGTDALAALDSVGARCVPWDEAVRTPYDLTLAASPKGELDRLRGPLVLLPHGAGFGKTLPDEGTADSASGLDPAYLLRRGTPLAALHALAHRSQVAELAVRCPAAAARATVVGDPTLDRLLASQGLRDRYRTALGTGGRRLIALTSTWGPESLLASYPDLPARLSTELPADSYQLALIMHPNDYGRSGAHDLAERHAPALAAGLLTPRPYEEWAAVLVAADGVLTDHGSTALYAAALDRPLLAVCDGGDELIPGSPMARLLAAAPKVSGAAADTGRAAEDIVRAIEGHLPGSVRALAEPAFAERGRALPLLRTELYARLRLTPPATPAEPRLLPVPRVPAHAPAVHAVSAAVDGDRVRVERRPPHHDGPAGHLAAEEDAASVRHAQSAAVLFRRAGDAPAAAARAVAGWTVDGWITWALDRYPGRRTAAVVLSASHCVLRRRGGPLLSARIGACTEAGRVFRPDPAAVVSAVHCWLIATRVPSLPATLDCRIGDRSYPVRLAPATDDEADHAF